MVQDLVFKDEARQKVRAGVDKLANAVKVTLGAKGRNVLIDNGYDSPQITKDGVTVARSINLEDPIENMGARLIKDVAHKTNEQAGDGTTTATVLAQAIYSAGMKMLGSGYSPIGMQRGIDKAVKAVVANLKSISKPVEDIETIKSVATISANGDTEIGEYIAQAIGLVSRDGVITIDNSKSSETSIEVTEGMQFSKGYLSPYFVTDEVKMETVYQNPLILLSNKRISLVRELLPLLEFCVVNKRPLLIIADEIDSEALQALIINKMAGNIQVCAVKAPNYGAIRVDMMTDIAVLTGGEVVDDKLGMKLDEMDFETQLGTSSKVVITANETTIIGGAGTKEMIEQRVEVIKFQSKNAASAYDKEYIDERLAKLAGGVAVIYVGGGSEVAIKERRDRFEDSLNATRAAIAEGVVPGGGVALLRCLGAVDAVAPDNADEVVGVGIIREAIKVPFRVIMENADESADVRYNQVMNIPNEFVIDTGFNVSAGKLEMFFETGVIDPTKVTRVALENAASVAGLLLTTECVVYNVKEEVKHE